MSVSIPVPAQVLNAGPLLETPAFRIWMSRISQFAASRVRSTNTLIGPTTYTAVLLDDIILADATLGNVTITLMPANSYGAGFSPDLRIKRIDASGNTVTVATTGADTVDGLATAPLTAHESKDFNSNGVSAWFIT